MPPKLDVAFSYDFNPTVTLRVTSPRTGASVTVRAIIDTGADRSVLDSFILQDIDPDAEMTGATSFTGAGGAAVDVAFYEVELALLDRDDMRVTLPIAFAFGLRRSVGHLIGLDVLEHFDFALAHRDRLGYLGRR